MVLDRIAQIALIFFGALVLVLLVLGLALASLAACGGGATETPAGEPAATEPAMEEHEGDMTVPRRRPTPLPPRRPTVPRRRSIPLPPRRLTVPRRRSIPSGPFFPARASPVQRLIPWRRRPSPQSPPPPPIRPLLLLLWPRLPSIRAPRRSPAPPQALRRRRAWSPAQRRATPFPAASGFCRSPAATVSPMARYCGPTTCPTPTTFCPAGF